MSAETINLTEVQQLVKKSMYMANQDKINESARKELSDERNKYGFNKALGEDDEEDLDRGNIDDDEDSDEEDEDDNDEDTKKDSKKDEQDEDDSEDSDEDSDKEDDEEDEDEIDESEKDEVNPKKVKIFEKYNKIRKELKEAKAKVTELLDSNKKLEDKLPDDFDAELTKFTKEVGVEDPESLKKIVDFLKKFAVDKNASKLQSQIEDLKKEVENAKASKPVADEFPDEWKAFRDDIFVKEFPNATKDELKTVRAKMEVLAKTKGVGGKPYIDKETGKEVLDPYPLDYIYFKHKDKFAELVTTKKSGAMESARTAGINTKEKQENTDLEKPLPKNASGDAIRKIDQKYRNLENKMSGGLRGDGDNTI